MTRHLRAAASALALLCVVACQGSYSSGPQIPNTLPSGAVQSQTGASPGASATPATSALTVQTQSFAFSDAAKGYTCPQANGFGCFLRLNVPAESPSPSPSAGKSAKASASPVPSPSVSASASPGASASPESSASPAASPTAAAVSGPVFALTMTALPNDAPKMVITSKDAPATTALIRVTLVPSADFTLDGRAIAQFTLPKDQIADRGFALQFFEETVRRKRHDVHPLYTLAKSTLEKQTLTFTMTPPKITLPKGHKYFVVLYGDQRAATPSPSPGGSASPAAALSASPSAMPSVYSMPTMRGSASPQPTPTP